MANKTLTELEEYAGGIEGDEVLLISKQLNDLPTAGIYSSYNYKLSSLEQDISNVMYPQLCAEIDEHFRSLSGEISSAFTLLSTLSTEISALSNETSAAIEAVREASCIMSTFISTCSVEVCSFVSSYEAAISNVVPNVNLLMENAVRISAISESGDFEIRDDGVIILRKELKVESFSTNPTVEVIGKPVSQVELRWKTNKALKSVSVNDVEMVDPSLTSYVSSFSEVSSGTYPFTLTVSDGKQTVTSTTSFAFGNEVYWGSAVSTDVIIDGGIDAGYVKTHFSKNVSRSYVKQFTANAGDKQYIFYLIQHTEKPLQFGYNGFWGGISRGDSTYKFINSAGYEADYDVYISDNPKLGQVTIDVKE